MVLHIPLTGSNGEIASLKNQGVASFEEGFLFNLSAGPIVCL